MVQEPWWGAEATGMQQQLREHQQTELQQLQWGQEKQEPQQEPPGARRHLQSMCQRRTMAQRR